jgi:uncharacterized beta-barrel protein YwiB (DUF1934 family)
MNMRDVIISIVGTQKDPSGQKDTVELVTDGQYGFEDGESRLTYEESALTGLNGTRTTFTVSPMGVILRREGSLNSEMVFQEGKKNFFLYETPYGSATMGVDTRRIFASLGEHGGDLELDYDIDFNHAPMGQNIFKINVKENNNG